MAKRCSSIKPADLDKRLTIQTRTRSSDSQGGGTLSWTSSDTVWAMIEPLSGYEKTQAQRLSNPMSHKVTLLYRSGITVKDRLVYGSRTFTIKEVINVDEQSVFLILKCIEE